MSSDWVWPDNPKRRQRIVDLATQVDTRQKDVGKLFEKMETEMEAYLENYKQTQAILDITDPEKRKKALEKASVKQQKKDADAVIADLKIDSVDALFREAANVLSAEELERLKNKMQDYESSALHKWILPIISLVAGTVAGGAAFRFILTGAFESLINLTVLGVREFANFRPLMAASVFKATPGVVSALYKNNYTAWRQLGKGRIAGLFRYIRLGWRGIMAASLGGIAVGFAIEAALGAAVGGFEKSRLIPEIQEAQVARLCCERIYQELDVVVSFLSTFRSIKRNTQILAMLAPSVDTDTLIANAQAAIEHDKKKLTDEMAETTWDKVFSLLEKKDNPENGTAAYTADDLPKADAIKKAEEFIQQELDAVKKEKEEEDRMRAEIASQTIDIDV